jgi:hypothetical protein
MQMTRILAGIFDDEQAATAAAHALRHAGFEAADLDQFALNPPGRHHALPLGGDEDADPKAVGGDSGALKGAAIGSAVGAVVGIAATPVLGPVAIAGGAAAGAYAGSLAGAVERMGDDRPAPQPRPAGVVVAVNAEREASEDEVIGVLREHRARMIERAVGAWRDGKWADFDPVRPPDIVELNAAADHPDRHPKGNSR